MFIYLATHTSIPSESEQNFTEILKVKFPKLIISTIQLSQLDQALKGPGILFTNTNFTEGDLEGIELNDNNCYVDYALNDGRKFIESKDNDKISSLKTLDEEYYDGLYPVGIYSFINDSSLGKVLSAAAFHISPLPQRDMAKKKSPSLFLDRDGIINVDTGYLHRVEDLIIRPGVENVIKFFNSRNWPVICITNQSGIARGMFGENAVKQLHNEINNRLSALDCKINHFEIAPFHYSKGVGKYKKHSALRKPMPGMIHLSSKYFNIDFKNSVMIGDKNSDKLHNFKLKTLLLQGEYELSAQFGTIINDFNEALQEINKLYKTYL